MCCNLLFERMWQVNMKMNEHEENVSPHDLECQPKKNICNVFILFLHHKLWTVPNISPCDASCCTIYWRPGLWRLLDETLLGRHSRDPEDNAPPDVDVALGILVRTTVDGQNIQTLGNHRMLNPHTPNLNVSGRVFAKVMLGVWFLSSTGAHAPQATLTLNFGGKGVVLDSKGLNISSIYGSVGASDSSEVARMDV